MKRSTATPAPASQSVPAESIPDSSPFPYRDYVAAKTTLEKALAKNVFYALVTGVSGTGKTSLVRDISASLDRHQHQLLYFPTPKVSLLSIVRYFAQALRVTPRRSSLETIKIIADAVQAQSTRLVVWIDEANGIPLDTLSELRTIAEFKHEVPQIFSIILSGTPELRTLIDTPALFALKRRITLMPVLEGLRRDELDAFLLHRFGAADASRVAIGLRDDLFERTRSIPALIDRVARFALDRAGKGQVTDEHLREAFDAAGL